MRGNYSQIAQGSRMNPPNRRARGAHLWNWADSLIQAKFFSIVDGDPVEYGWSVNDCAEVLVFCQDYPVIFRPFEFDNDHANGVALQAPRLERNNWDNIFAMGNVLYTTTQSMPLKYKEAAWGTTITHGVEVSGYPYLLRVYVNGITAPRLEADLATNGTIMAGKANTHSEDIDFEAHTALLTEVVPCFLLETDYTYAIAAADNTYQHTFTSGPVDYDFTLLVCGIFQEVVSEG